MTRAKEDFFSPLAVSMATFVGIDVAAARPSQAATPPPDPESPPSKPKEGLYVLANWINWEHPNTFQRLAFLPVRYADGEVEREYVRFVHRHNVVVAALFQLFSVSLLLMNVLVSPKPEMKVVCGIALTIVVIVLAMDLILRRIILSKYSPILNASPRLSEELTCREESRVALVHEYTFFVALLAGEAAFGFAFYVDIDSCKNNNYIGKQPTASGKDEYCIHSVRAIGAAILSSAVFSGKPRMHLSVVVGIAYLIAAYAARVINPIDSTEDMLLKLLIDVTGVALVLYCQLVLEQSHRGDFEEYVKADCSKSQASRQKCITDQYLSQLLPPVLYARIVSQENYEDRSSCASVFVAAVHDLQWLGEPASVEDVVKAVENVSELMSRLEALHKHACVERIRVSGDQFVATSNLIMPTIHHAMRIAIFASAVRNSLQHSQVPLRCAVHSGPLVGTVTRTRFLRYDISGEGINVAMKMLVFCENGETIVSSASTTLFGGRVELLPWSAPPSLAVNIPTQGTGEPWWYLVAIVARRVALPLPSDEYLPTEEPLLNAVEADTSNPKPTIHFRIEQTAAATTAIVSSPNAPQDNNSLSPTPMPTHTPRTQLASSNSSHPNDAAPSEDSMLTSSRFAEQLKREADNLEIVSSCFNMHFADPATESKYSTKAEQFHIRAANCSMFLVMLVLFIVELVEFRGFDQSVLTGQVLTAVAVLILIPFVVLHVQTRFSREIMLLFISLHAQTVVFGPALTRPSLVSNNEFYLNIIVLDFTYLVIGGAAWERATVYSLVVIQIPFTIAAFFPRGVVSVQALGFAWFFFALYVLMLRWHEKFARLNYQNQQLMSVASDIEQKERELLRDALAAVIPTPMLQPLLNEASAKKPRKFQGIELFVSRGVVVLLQFPDITYSEEIPTTSTAEASRMGLSAVAMAVAEKTLRGFEHLTLTKVVSNTVLAAGPLASTSDSAKGAAQEALDLLETVRGRCTAAIVSGSFYAVVSGGAGRSWPSFFLVGDAIRSARLLCSRIEPLAYEMNDEFQSLYMMLGGYPVNGTANPLKPS